MGEENVRAGFRATGLIPYNLEIVISQLDFKPKTPTPSNSRPGTATSWGPKTPITAIEAIRSSTTLESRIARHQSSSPTHLYEVVDAQARGISTLAHRLVLLKAENRELRTVNELLSKRRRAKKKPPTARRIAFCTQSRCDTARKGIINAGGENTPGDGRHVEGAQPRTQRCGNCSQTGHNSRTC